MVRAIKEVEGIDCPAEDLSTNDDLLSWILVDQLGCLPGKGLGVHPQQVKFVGPTFKTSEILKIVTETVVNTNKEEAKRRLLDFHLIKAHMESKVTEKQRIRFKNHLVRYTLPYRPDSRIEIFTTDRYKAVTGHGELAVYATRPLGPGDLVEELQGSIVPLPDQWREEMEIGEDFAMVAAGEEESEEGSDGDEEGTRTKEPKGARRSDRTKRRDFSIIWSEKDKRYQLFLGPARFLNHDCNPNVDLSRQGQYVTFRVMRPIKIGEEITTHYGPNYFGKDNIECLCLTCELAGKGGFTKKPGEAEFPATGSCSASVSTPTRNGSPASSGKPVKPVALRKALVNLTMGPHRDDAEPVAGPSGTSHEDSIPVTPRKVKPKPSLLSLGRVDSPATDATGSEPESPSESGPPQRERYQRKAAKNAQHFSFLKRPKKGIEANEPTLLMDEEDAGCVRCTTCAVAIHDREWDKNNHYYWDYCPRCVRHALIFELPWPAHHPSQVLDYPPSHLIPYGYIPPRVSSIPLPSLEKNQKKHAKPAPVAPQGESAAERIARIFSEARAKEDLEHGQMREAAWTALETAQNQLIAAEQAKIDAREKRLEAKRKLEENKFKGSGVWQRWQYIDDAEHERREAAKHAVTTGTRRGRRYKADDDEEEERRLAEEIAARRRAEARAEEDESDADDEAEEGEQDEEPVVEARVQQEHDSEIVEVKKENIDPKSSPRKATYKATVYDKCRTDVIVISSTDNSEFEIESDGGMSVAAKSRRAERKAKKRNAKAAKDLEGYDSDIIMISVQEHQQAKSRKRSAGVIMSSNPKQPSSPIRRTAKTKPSGQAKRNKVNGDRIPDMTVDDTGSGPDLMHRGRGRPTGTGRRQRLAAARNEALASVGLSNTTEDQMSLGRRRETEDHIQIRIEAELAKMQDDGIYEILVEGLDKDEKFVWTSINAFRSNPFEFEQPIVDWLRNEKQAYRASLENGYGGIDEKTITTNKAGRKLPGQEYLLPSSTVKEWGPRQIGEPDILSQLYTGTLSLPPLPRGADRHEVVGVIFDPGYLENGRPSISHGPWLNGQLRFITAATRTRTDSVDPPSAQIDEDFESNNNSDHLKSKVMTPTIKYIQPPSVDIGRTDVPASPISRASGSSATPSKPASRPVNATPTISTPHTLVKTNQTGLNGSAARHSGSTAKKRPNDSTPTKATFVPDGQTVGNVQNGSAVRLSAAPSTSAGNPGHAVKTTPTPSKQTVTGSTSRSSVTPSKSVSRPVGKLTPTTQKETIHGSSSRSLATPSKMVSRTIDKATPTTQKEIVNGSSSRSSATPSKSVNRPKTAVPVKIAPKPTDQAANHVSTLETSIPVVNGNTGKPSQPGSEINGSASEENGFSTGTSQAEDEVEAVLDGARKRKSSVIDSPRRVKAAV